MGPIDVDESLYDDFMEGIAMDVEAMRQEELQKGFPNVIQPIAEITRYEEESETDDTGGTPESDDTGKAGEIIQADGTSQINEANDADETNEEDMMRDFTDNLYSVDWSSLTCASGRAIAVPYWLESISTASDEELARNDTFATMKQQLFSTEYAYSATPVVISLLLQLAGFSDMPRRGRILGLVRLLAVVMSGVDTSFGMQITKWRELVGRVVEDVPMENGVHYGADDLAGGLAFLKSDINDGIKRSYLKYKLNLRLSAYDTVLPSIPLLNSIALNDKLPDARLEAVRLLSYYPTHSFGLNGSLETLTRLLGIEEDETVRWAAIIGIGLLQKQTPPYVLREYSAIPNPEVAYLVAEQGRFASRVSSLRCIKENSQRPWEVAAADITLTRMGFVEYDSSQRFQRYLLDTVPIPSRIRQENPHTMDEEMMDHVHAVLCELDAKDYPELTSMVYRKVIDLNRAPRETSRLLVLCALEMAFHKIDHQRKIVPFEYLDDCQKSLVKILSSLTLLAFDFNCVSRAICLFPIPQSLQGLQEYIAGSGRWAVSF